MIACLTATVALAFAGVAIASTTITYFSGTSGSELGPFHPLTNTTVGSIYGALVCTSAENPDFSQAGTAYCVDGAGNTTTHPYNGSYRYGWCGTPVGYPAGTMNCRETW